MTAVTVEHVSKHYELGGATVRALDNVSLEIEGGEFIALAGTSGSGKTTLLNIIGTIESPTSGSIKLNSVDTSELTPDELSDFRAKEIGFIFQTFNLLPVLTAAENVQYPLFLRKLRPRERRMRAEDALEAVGLLRYREHRPSELSGGQRQRVAIARALVAEPTIILADEP